MEQDYNPFEVKISQDEFLKQYTYVKKVVKSCETPLQLEAAKRWAEDWSYRMKRCALTVTIDADQLYRSVIE